MTSEYAPLTPEILRRAAELVLSGERGGMCLAVVVETGSWEPAEASLRRLYAAAEGEPWEVDLCDYLVRFGPPAKPNASGERAACLRRMADWLEAREVGHDG